MTSIDRIFSGIISDKTIPYLHKISPEGVIGPARIFFKGVVDPNDTSCFIRVLTRPLSPWWANYNIQPFYERLNPRLTFSPSGVMLVPLSDDEDGL